ncbi:hypothetical protein [Aquimarina sp. 2201CG5-10]|uniref:hypothetical protein n=1 Tax=Aquimarina callyspongiae TaxID=3098150 RepID=UPI002AB457C2|nr:hypothetical protein [Aquimarina sp. 2201CG5-10]MDY8137163.1 hypothetical protein [Aquimarina sp. 2201CG5-10]
MRLEYTCAGCKKQNNFTPVTTTRGDLQMKVGDEVNINCDHCGKDDIKHINRIDAVVDNRKILIALAISAVITIFLWSFYGAIGTITGTIPIFVWIYESRATNDFNSYKIRRR